VAWLEWLDYVAAQPGPKIIVVQDLDSPQEIRGSFWGEVSAATHRALGCEGVIVDGAVRDIDEMTEVGFKAIARRLCVGHAHTTPVRWGEPVTVFGRRVEPGQLIHADKHGFLAIPREDETKILDAARFLDDNECDYLIPAVREFAGLSREQFHEKIGASLKGYGAAANARFTTGGEWLAPPAGDVQSDATGA
jgi:regulator of RNase E activity RraA